MEIQNNLVGVDSYYGDYSYFPSSPSGLDYFSDFLLGTDNVSIKNQNKLNWDMMMEQNKFNEYMSGTSYQRAIRDMEKAGINPMLAAINGGSFSPYSASVNQSSVQSFPQSAGNFIKNVYKDFKDNFKVLLSLASVLL